MSGRQGPGRLHVVTDATLQRRFRHAQLARLAFEGGADTVQLREKRDGVEVQLEEEAGRCVALARRHGARLVIDDRVELARRSGADGVHLGSDDLDPEIARRLLGPAVLIGRTVNNLEQARHADRQAVDYLGVGPVFGTASKARPAPLLGLEALRTIVRAVSKPVIAIGGMTPERLLAVMRTGVHGVAVLSAVVLAPDPAAATLAFREALRRFDEYDCEATDGRRVHETG